MPEITAREGDTRERPDGLRRAMAAFQVAVIASAIVFSMRPEPVAWVVRMLGVPLKSGVAPESPPEESPEISPLRAPRAGQ